MPFFLKGLSKIGGATVYQKHSSLQRCKPKYRGWSLPSARRLSGDVSLLAKHSSEARVNGGRNYNGPKVAKFLVN
ncbi:hypothetical protein B5M19_02165 [Mesomycoplasma hyopneumoniae]|nr:hypothetical protein B5M19_02165 [Mesomycoplasma hyopneumoniae]